MDSTEHSNGHRQVSSAQEFDNPYLDVAEGSQPPEIVEFALHTDPYANMLPRVNAPSWGAESNRGRSPFIVAVSIFLILVLILPAMAEVFARLLH